MDDPTALPPKLARGGDTVVLRHLLAALEALERAWPDDARRRRALAAARRLADGAQAAGIALPPGARDLASRLGRGLEPRELVSLIVPLERALDRAVRDEDFLPLTDRSEPRADAMPVCVVADSLRSAWNVGGVFRTSECFGVGEVVLSGYSAGPDDARVARAAMGTDGRVTWSRHRSAALAVQALRERGDFVVALESDEEHPALESLELRLPCALLLGNERFGLAPSVVADADARARIPICGAKASLNVVSALAIALHELRRRFDAERAAFSPRPSSSSRPPRAPRR